MRKSRVIALFAFKEGVRDRFMVAFLILALVIVGSAYYLSLFSAVKERVAFWINLISLFYYLVTFFTIFFVPLKISFEMSQNMALIYRSKPLSPWEFVFGKFLGYGALLSLSVIFLFILTLIFIHKPIPVASYFSALLFEQFITLSAAILFGLYASQSVAVLLTFMFYFLAHTTYEFAKVASDNGVVQLLSQFFYTLFPSYDFYDLSPLVVYGIAPTVPLWRLGLYSLIYTLLILSLAALLYRRREL
ncbi:MAG: hypothetical protein GXO19_01565 [Epsilonproteobacteria bacterium]|nr:hypothetical protein [Campylobacterota bacterium]NPA56403.1 hypothetical protein [Campylobacterota bacterium]